MAYRLAHDGRIALTGSEFRSHPHRQAVYNLGEMHQTTEAQLRRRYEHAALLFASGTVWATTSVQRGDTPPLVEFETDTDGDAVPHSLEMAGLTGYAGESELTAAYQAVQQRLVTGDDPLADTADAVYAYGILAQRAMHHVFLESRRVRNSEPTTMHRAGAAHGVL